MRRNISVVFFVIFLVACSKDGHIDIEVSDTHLEEVPAGDFLADFNIIHEPGADDPKSQILTQLREKGKLRDEHKHKENGNTVTTLVWDYEGHTIKEQYYRGGIWRGPKVVPYQEYYEGQLAVWITFELPDGIPYSELLPDHYRNINPNRIYEHTATIRCKADQSRLFLFGFGSLCQRISYY